MVVKEKGIRLLKELSKYVVILVIAGVVGYLAGHWGTSGAWAMAQDCVKEMSDPRYKLRVGNFGEFRAVDLLRLCEAEVKRPQDVPERVSRMLERIEVHKSLNSLHCEVGHLRDAVERGQRNLAIFFC